MEFQVSERETLLSWKTVILALESSSLKIYHYTKDRSTKVVDRSHHDSISYENLRIVEYPDQVFKLKFFKGKKMKRKFRAVTKEIRDKIVKCTRDYIEKYKIQSALSKNYLDTKKAIHKTKTENQKEKLEMVCVTLLPLLFKEFNKRLTKMKGSINDSKEENNEYSEMYYGFKGLINELNEKFSFIYDAITEMKHGKAKKEEKKAESFIGMNDSQKDCSFQSSYDIKFGDFINEDKDESLTNKSSTKNVSEYNMDDRSSENGSEVTHMKKEVIFEIEHLEIEVAIFKMIQPLEIEYNYHQVIREIPFKPLLIERNDYEIIQKKILNEMVIANSFFNVTHIKPINTMAIANLTYEIIQAKPKIELTINESFNIIEIKRIKPLGIHTEEFQVINEPIIIKQVEIVPIEASKFLRLSQNHTDHQFLRPERILTLITRQHSLEIIQKKTPLSLIIESNYIQIESKGNKKEYQPDHIQGFNLINHKTNNKMIIVNNINHEILQKKSIDQLEIKRLYLGVVHKERIKELKVDNDTTLEIIQFRQHKEFSIKKESIEIIKGNKESDYAIEHNDNELIALKPIKELCIESNTAQHFITKNTEDRIVNADLRNFIKETIKNSTHTQNNIISDFDLGLIKLNVTKDDFKKIVLFITHQAINSKKDKTKLKRHEDRFDDEEEEEIRIIPRVNQAYVIRKEEEETKTAEYDYQIINNTVNSYNIELNDNKWINNSNNLNQDIDININNTARNTMTKTKTSEHKTNSISRRKYYNFTSRKNLSHHIYIPNDLICEYIRQISTKSSNSSITKYEPITTTQKQCERMFNSKYLSNASHSNIKEEQLLSICTFILSELSLGINRLMKPIPSFLGETFEYCDNHLDYRFISEEVETSPSITAFIGESPEFKIEGDTRRSFVFKPIQNVFETKYSTDTLITLLPANEKFSYNLPITHLKTSSYLNPSIEYSGIIKVINRNDKSSYAEIAIASFEVNGRVYVNNKEQYQLTGSLLSNIKAIDSTKGNSTTIYNIPEEKYILNSLRRKHYYLPNESYNLNYADIELKSILPQSDARRRKDVKLYEKGNMSQAEEAYIKSVSVNEKHSSSSSNLIKGNTFQPKYFNNIQDEGYRYKGNYWNSYRKIHLS